MIDLFGSQDNGRAHCDGVSRRDFLKVGGMAAGGLSLGQLLEVEAKQKTGRSHKAVINIYLPGGPSHLDFFDLKPEAPKEIRGEFKPIKTNVPGVEICELFPRLARMADQYSIIRSLADSDGAHSSFQCMTGRRQGEKRTAPSGGWPSWGAWVSKLQGSQSGVPANLSLMYPTGNRTWGERGNGGFVGPAHSPMQLIQKDPNAKAQSLVLDGISLNRLNNRNRLLSAIDQFRRSADVTGQMDGLDVYNAQALGILSKSGLMDALDVSKEDPRIAERYGVNDSRYQRDGAPKMIRNFLVARRLVEAGARVVSLNYSRWDWHGGDGMNFPRSRQEMPLLDQLARDYEGRLKVLTISQDLTGTEAVGPFFARNRFTHLESWIDPQNHVGEDIGGGVMPTTVLYVGSEEVWRVQGDYDWSSEEARAAIDAAIAE